MPYSQYTLSQYITIISDLLDDTSAVYWTVPEIQYAVWEGLRVWGALTAYWKSRGSFAVSPTNPTNPYYDLAVYLPQLRTRLWTLNQMVQEIQYMLLEAPNGISGSGMSGQVSIQSILNAVQFARNRFVLDTHLPYQTGVTLVNPPPPDGLVSFNQSAVLIHRAMWQDLPSGVWTNLWIEDEWSADKNNPQWTLEPGNPISYSESDLSPLTLQLMPPPVNSGNLEATLVASFQMDLTNGASLFGIPDEWTHAIKYAALSQILQSEGQIKDPLRAQYAEMRYQQSVDFAKDATSIVRLLCNNQPLPLDSLMAVDASSPYWRNQGGRPQCAGALYDIVTINPGVPDQTYGISADVVQSAPLPQLTDFIQMGEEDLDNMTDYVCHVLAFKCGGNEFKSTMGNYDGFLKAVSMRKGVDAAKIRYLEPLFQQAQKEWQERPDRMKQNA